MKSLNFEANNIIDDGKKEKIIERIRAETARIKNYTPKVAIFGDSGVGKSSLCNALFGKDVAAISDITACTREPQEILLSSGDGGIILIDVPGIGEDPARHLEYKELYKSLLPNLDLVLWAIKADDRKYSTSIEVYNEILKPNIENCPVLFVITQVDKIEPHRKWNEEGCEPGPEQMANLNVKMLDISTRFEASAGRIVAVAANESWNMIELVERIVDILPNEKKYSFAREALEENVSEETIRKVENGFFNALKEKFSNVFEFVKNDLQDIVLTALSTDTIKSAAAGAIKSVAKSAAIKMAAFWKAKSQ